jgi:hypothetical protein
MKLESHIQELALTLEIDAPALEGGVYNFDFEDDIKVSVKELDLEGYTFDSVVCTIDDELLSEDLLQIMLQGNLFGQLTGGSALALSPEKNEITLKKDCYKILNSKEFIEDFEDFINYVDFWKEEVPQQINQKKQQKGLL